MKILFICWGNICRSPMAEFVLKDMVRKEGLADRFVIESAATTNDEIWNGVGNPIYPQALAELKRHGIGTKDNELGCSKKRARLLKQEDYARYDMIIGMDDQNMRQMKRICGGDPEEKITLLMDYTERPGDVADPWFTRDFSVAWRDIQEGCEGLLLYLKESGRV